MEVHAPSITPGTALFPHPEAGKGEVFLTNCLSDEPDAFENIDYQTKRAGLTAIDQQGNVLNHLFPVFVSQAEYNIKHREVTVGQ